MSWLERLPPPSVSGNGGQDRLESPIVAGPETEGERVAIAMKNVCIYYGHFLAVDGITLDIPANKITALIGPSGCGKSTLLRSINRMNDFIPGARLTGEIIFGGNNLYAPEVDAVEVRRRIGMIFQKPNPFPKSIFNNVAYGPRLLGQYNKSILGEIVERSLKQAALWDEVKRDLKKSGLQLSGGQQQRLCIARAIAVEPEILLMDEPCSSLDQIATSKIEALMAELRTDYTIVIVTHNLQQASRAADYTAYMLANGQSAGELIEFNVTSELFNKPRDKRTEDYITGRFG